MHTGDSGAKDTHSGPLPLQLTRRCRKLPVRRRLDAAWAGGVCPLLPLAFFPIGSGMVPAPNAPVEPPLASSQNSKPAPCLACGFMVGARMLGMLAAACPRRLFCSDGNPGVGAGRAS